MPVDVTYCLSEWEKYFTEKPLSFNEFVDTYIAKPAIFPHILKTIDEISCQPSKLEYFIQGFIGSGKATLIYLLTAYKVYLYLILKSASEFYDFISSADISMIIFAPDKKSASLTVNAFLTILEGIPFFKKVRTISECFDCKDTALYTTAYPDDLLTFKRNNNILHVIAAKDETDLINTNPIIGVFTELDAFKKKGVSMEMVFGFYQKLSWRIESRCKGKFSTIIVEKNPGSLYEDTFDRIMYDNKDLKEVSSDSLYEIVTFIEQNVFVFDDSIENNITMFSDVDKILLQEVIEKSGLKSLVEEKGLNYKCGENGCNLSGGEKQRIAIARGLLKNSKIIVKYIFICYYICHFYKSALFLPSSPSSGPCIHCCSKKDE